MVGASGEKTFLSGVVTAAAVLLVLRVAVVVTLFGVLHFVGVNFLAPIFVIHFARFRFDDACFVRFINQS